MPLLPILILSAALVATAARGAWVADTGGRCVEQWSPSDMLRRPIAIVTMIADAGPTAAQ